MGSNAVRFPPGVLNLALFSVCVSAVPLTTSPTTSTILLILEPVGPRIAPIFCPDGIFLGTSSPKTERRPSLKSEIFSIELLTSVNHPRVQLLSMALIKPSVKVSSFSMPYCSFFVSFTK